MTGLLFSSALGKAPAASLFLFPAEAPTDSLFLRPSVLVEDSTAILTAATSSKITAFRQFIKQVAPAAVCRGYRVFVMWLILGLIFSRIVAKANHVGDVEEMMAMAARF